MTTPRVAIAVAVVLLVVHSDGGVGSHGGAGHWSGVA